MNVAVLHTPPAFALLVNASRSCSMSHAYPAPRRELPGRVLDLIDAGVQGNFLDAIP